jgi:anti-sigma regulatory factor (Ser/Thr protein kinase)
MRHGGYRHELRVYESDDDLVEFLVPFVHEGAAARQPVFVHLPARETALVRGALGNGDRAGTTFLGAAADHSPASRIRTLRSLLGDLAGSGGEHARIASSVPHPGLGAPWYPWCRYEAAVNELLADLPLRGVCLYDRRATPADVLADVERTHPHVYTANGTPLSNGRYEPPWSFLPSMPPAPPDPLEATSPTAVLVDPWPVDARFIVEQAAERTSLTGAQINDLELAVSEALTNAIRHGRPPITMQLWTAPERLVVAITDRGTGPEDPYAGLIPRPAGNGGVGGYGLWLTHQLTTVTHSRGDGDFTIRLIAGAPLPPSERSQPL